jgi:hypothetical protein
MAHSGKVNILRALLLALTWASAACSLGPSASDVKDAFARDNPSVDVVSVSPGEGDGEHVYMHIRFRREGAPQLCEAVWGYREAQPKWVVFGKSDPVCR